MEFKYTINDISTKCNVSVQSLYKLINKNKPFITDNSTRRQRKIYYNQTAMDFFTAYYLSEQTPETPQIAEEQAEVKSSADPRIEALKAENDALHAEIESLRKQLEAKENERLELFRQNGALILTLQQEKQEKMLLLPAPKKTIGARIKGLFRAQGQT